MSPWERGEGCSLIGSHAKIVFELAANPSVIFDINPLHDSQVCPHGSGGKGAAL